MAFSIAVEVSAPQADEQTLEDTFTHRKIDELCRIMDLKKPELRQAEVVVQRVPDKLVKRRLLPRPGKLTKPVR